MGIIIIIIMNGIFYTNNIGSVMLCQILPLLLTNYRFHNNMDQYYYRVITDSLQFRPPVNIAEFWVLKHLYFCVIGPNIMLSL